MKKSNTKYLIALSLIVVVAAVYRFYGQSWDGGYLFHPDERKIVLVASDLSLPSSVLQFFSSESPLNPKFFAYGSFPIYLLRGLSVLAPAGPYNIPWRQDSFVALGMLGRTLSALFDLGTIVLLFFLARRLYDARVGIITSALVAVTVLDIQLSHFYAVDTLLTLLVAATLFFTARYAQRAQGRDLVGMALLFGLALATKVTAAPLIVPIVIAVLKAKQAGQTGPASPPIGEDLAPEPRLEPALATGLGIQPSQSTMLSQASALSPNRLSGRLPTFGSMRSSARGWAARVWDVRRTLAKVLLIAFAVFVITQPYALLDPVRYFGQVGTEALVARGWLDYPYTRQYANTIPFFYQIVQSSIWGMGLPLGIFAWAGAALFIWQWWRGREWRDGFLISWAAVYFLTVGGQHAKYLRYLLPMMPFLLLIAVVAWTRLWRSAQLKSLRPAQFSLAAGFLAVGLSSLLYATGYDSLYSREHPWLQISGWIYQNVPAHSSIIIEQWDDALPMPMDIGGVLRTPNEYTTHQLPMYDPDNPAKLQMLADALASSDYVLLASQRLYDTIPRLPARYPISTRYYDLLFSGQLGYELATYARNDISLGNVVITNDPFSDAGLPVPSALRRAYSSDFVWNWGKADESFVVYDHPTALLFKKIKPLSADELRALLTVP